jgi:hypothetical protein
MRCLCGACPFYFSFEALAKVITGVKFKDGIEATQVDEVAA